MKQIHSSEFLTISYNEDLRLLKSCWSAQTANATEEQMKAEMLVYAELINQLAPQRILADTSHYLFLVTVEIQDWVAKNFLSATNKKGIKRAYLNTTDVIAQLSIEQANDEVKNRLYDLMYFDKEEDAMAWLLGNA